MPESVTSGPPDPCGDTAPGPARAPGRGKAVLELLSLPGAGFFVLLQRASRVGVGRKRPGSTASRGTRRLRRPSGMRIRRHIPARGPGNGRRFTAFLRRLRPAAEQARELATSARSWRWRRVLPRAAGRSRRDRTRGAALDFGGSRTREQPRELSGLLSWGLRGLRACRPRRDASLEAAAGPWGSGCSRMRTARPGGRSRRGRASLTSRTLKQARELARFPA